MKIKLCFIIAGAMGSQGCTKKEELLGTDPTSFTNARMEAVSGMTSCTAESGTGGDKKQVPRKLPPYRVDISCDHVNPNTTKLLSPSTDKIAGSKVNKQMKNESILVKTIAEKSLLDGLSIVKEKINSVILPSLEVWPRLPESGEAVKGVRREVKSLTQLVNVNDEKVRNELSKFCGELESWMKFFQDWMIDVYLVRYDQGFLLTDFYPFLLMHSDVVSFARCPSSRLVETYMRELKDELDSCLIEGKFRESSLYSPWNGVEETNLVELSRRVELLAWVGNILELEVSHLMMSAKPNAAERKAQFQSLFCRQIDDAIHLVKSAVCDTGLEERGCLRASRWIVSVVELCKSNADTKERRKIMQEHLRFAFRFTPRDAETILVSSRAQEVVVRDSFPLLRDDAQDFESVRNVDFGDSATIGSAQRKHWLQSLFDFAFNPGNNLFYTWGAQNYLIPSSNANEIDLFAVGRIIALAIREGLTIGARLGPCGIALLRHQPHSFEIADCVAAEDPQSFALVNYLSDEMISVRSERPEHQRSHTFLGQNHTEVSFPAFNRKRMFETGIKPIRESYMVIKRGINSVFPIGALSVFTDAEFETMIIGQGTLSSEELIRGTRFSRDSAISLWLTEIIREEPEGFRFDFNQFATGTRQPPLDRTHPWIEVLVCSPEDEELVQAKINLLSGRVRIPLYPSKKILERNLRLAMYGNRCQLREDRCQV